MSDLGSRPGSALARALTRPLAPLDGPVNAVTDTMNEWVPWLWWPLAVPSRGEPMPPAAHALYVAHAGLGWLALRALGVRVGVRLAAAGALAGWAPFTGAWDRRALVP